MKKIKLITLAAVSMALQISAVPSVKAQEIYPAYLNTVSVATNSSTGELTYHRYANWDVIHACAAEAGLTNTMGLKLVYDRTADALEVVSGTNNTVVCTPLTFNAGVALNNTNSTKIQRLAFVYWETNQVTSGTLLASERLAYNTNGVAWFRLNGQLQFAFPGDGTNSAAIYAGSLVAGSGLFDEDEDWGEGDQQSGPSAGGEFRSHDH